jgi:hypothetical protein
LAGWAWVSIAAAKTKKSIAESSRLIRCDRFILYSPLGIRIYRNNKMAAKVEFPDQITLVLLAEFYPKVQEKSTGPFDLK